MAMIKTTMIQSPAAAAAVQSPNEALSSSSSSSKVKGGRRWKNVFKRRGNKHNNNNKTSCSSPGKVPERTGSMSSATSATSAASGLGGSFHTGYGDSPTIAIVLPSSDDDHEEEDDEEEEEVCTESSPHTPKGDRFYRDNHPGQRVWRRAGRKGLRNRVPLRRQRRPSLDNGSLSSCTGDELDLNEDYSPTTTTWAPEAPPAIDTTDASQYYGYEDATPYGYGSDDIASDNESSDECASQQTHSTNGEDSVPQVPSRRVSGLTVNPPFVPRRQRRSSIQFGSTSIHQEEVTTTNNKEEEEDDDDLSSLGSSCHQDNDYRQRRRRGAQGHEYLSQSEAHALMMSSPPAVPKRRPSCMTRRNRAPARASISFGGDCPGTMPVVMDRKKVPPPPISISPEVANQYGYEDATPDNKYGYGDASPSIASSSHNMARENGGRFGATPRRSSMKQVGVPRRASIQTAGSIEVNIPGHRNPVRRRTSITFASSEEVKKVTPSCNLTNEPEKLWYKKDELRQIRNKNYSIVHLVETGETTLKMCTRGLENMMETSQERLEQQQQSVESVLTLQHLQRNTGDYDSEYMSRLYQYTSKSSGEVAAERASKDAAAVEKYLKRTRMQCRRLSM